MDELTFADVLRQVPLNLVRAGLCVAREIAYPDLDIQHYLDRLKEYALEAGAGIRGVRSIRTRARGLSEFLFEEVGLSGNSAAYMDPRNSYLNEVLDRGLGIPISLSVIYIEIASCLNIRAFGVGLPGHFVVGIRGEAGVFYLDPFHGGRELSIEDCARLVEMSTGDSGLFLMEWLEPSEPAATLIRMLNNLRNAYLRAGDLAHTAAVIRRLKVAQPDSPYHTRDLGLIYYQMGSLRLAVRFLSQYLRAVPQAPDAYQIQRHLERAAAALARLN